MNKYTTLFYETADGKIPAKDFLLTNGFIKKTQRTPRKEIDLAKSYRADYYARKEKS